MSMDLKEHWNGKRTEDRDGLPGLTVRKVPLVTSILLRTGVAT